ncbi:MAG: hypothetical protein GEV06_19725 [Luteitalea sp.]|nr:hypothetical protein [Luteitalea sp.]
MNPIRLLKIFVKANRLFSLLEQGTASYEKEQRVSKSLLSSKTFWFNVVTAAVELSGVLPLPPGVAATVVGVGNIVIRLLTNQPVHVVPQR